MIQPITGVGVNDGPRLQWLCDLLSVKAAGGYLVERPMNTIMLPTEIMSSDHVPWWSSATSHPHMQSKFIKIFKSNNDGKIPYLN